MTRVIPTREFALHSLDGACPAGACPATPGTGPLPFSAARYSRYKYGSVTAAEAFARALGSAFCERCPDLVLARRLLMASSPYARVPAAATTLARRLRPVLNAVRTRNGLAPAPLLRVERVSTSAGDYGTLSAQARDLHMAANTLSFRRFPPRQVRDAHLLVVDDVRVTGAHQRCLMRASDDLPLTARTFLYIAAFPAPADGQADGQAGGPADGCFDPAQEDALNHAAVKTLGDLAGIVDAGDFAWNVRVCKFALSPANRRELPRFLHRMPDWFVRGLHRNSRLDGYARMDLYAPSHAVVRAEVSRRPGGRLPVSWPPA